MTCCGAITRPFEGIGDACRRWEDRAALFLEEWEVYIIINIHHYLCTFSNPVSTHDSPTCGDAQFLT